MNHAAYVVYGANDEYFISAKFSIISLLANIEAPITVIVLTDHPDYFNGLPVTIIELSESLKKAWSLDGRYHFRIKNRGLAYIIDQLQLDLTDNIIALDADTYFLRSITPIFDRLNDEWSTIFRKEGTIRRQKRFTVYLTALDGKTFTKPSGKTYQMSNNAEMWGSLLYGFKVSNRSILDTADDIMLCLLEHVNAHTIEQFSLTEAFRGDHQIFESKSFVKHYSTSGKKRHAITVLTDFFESHSHASFEDLKRLSKQVKLSRNFFELLRSRYERHAKKV